MAGRLIIKYQTTNIYQVDVSSRKVYICITMYLRLRYLCFLFKCLAGQTSNQFKTVFCIYAILKCILQQFYVCLLISVYIIDFLGSIQF